MANIIIAEDDSGTRMLIAAVLRKGGHTVAEFPDGQAAYEAALASPPDLLVSDVNMPRMDGLALANALRANEATADVPVILLTSLAERADMRAGMTSGADDYITKPFLPKDLQQAVTAQLSRKATRAALQSMATERALNEQQHDLEKMYAGQIGDDYALRVGDSDIQADERVANGTLLYVDIVSYNDMAQRLNSVELSAVIKCFYGFASDTINLFGAKQVQFEGTNLFALFAGDQDTQTVTHGLRAVRAAHGLLDAEARANAHLQTLVVGRAVPPLRVCMALDTGSINITHMKDSLGTGRAHSVVVGEPVSVAKGLAAQAALRNWRLGASVATLRTVMGAVRTGDRAMLTLPGRAALDAAEIKSLMV